MELKIDVTISEDLSSSTAYSTVKSKVHIAVSINPLNTSICPFTYISIYLSIYSYIYIFTVNKHLFHDTRIYSRYTQYKVRKFYVECDLIIYRHVDRNVTSFNSISLQAA